MIEFFFDCSSPWTYLAFHNIQPLADELGEPIAWRPIMVGGVFNQVNPSVYAGRDNPVIPKRDYMLKDMRDWALLAGLKITMPPTVFPVNSVKAMRACLWLSGQERGEQRLRNFAREVFEAYWGRDEDISQDEVLTRLCLALGEDPTALMAGIGLPAVKAQLKANTDELIERGGFGSPTMFVNGDDMYFGNDRLELLRVAILRQRAAANGP